MGIKMGICLGQDNYESRPPVILEIVRVVGCGATMQLGSTCRPSACQRMHACRHGPIAVTTRCTRARLVISYVRAFRCFEQLPWRERNQERTPPDFNRPPKVSYQESCYASRFLPPLRRTRRGFLFFFNP